MDSVGSHTAALLSPSGEAKASPDIFLFVSSYLCLKNFQINSLLLTGGFFKCILYLYKVKAGGIIGFWSEQVLLSLA